MGREEGGVGNRVASLVGPSPSLSDEYNSLASPLGYMSEIIMTSCDVM